MVSIKNKSAQLVYVQNLEAAYGAKTVFSAPDFGLSRGERVALLGLNGTGKTTFLKLVGGLMWPARGEVSLLGNAWSPAVRGKLRSLVGYLGHETGVFEDMSVREFIKFANKLHGSKCSKGDVEGLVDQFELCEVLDEKISSLSFGFRKRTALASTLVRKPDLLLLDEPFHGLDVKQVRKMADYIQNLDPNISIIIGTHLVPFAQSICQSYAVFREGVLETGENWDDVQRYLEGTEEVPEHGIASTSAKGGKPS